MSICTESVSRHVRRSILCLLCVLGVLVTSPRKSEAVLLLAAGSGGQALLDPAASNVPGARGGLLAIQGGWLWEWQNSILALGLMLPVETDFGSRVALGPKFILELSGSFRVYVAAMADIGPPYSFFFIRGGLSAGWRNTGIRPDPLDLPVKAGVHLWVALDARIPNPNQLVPQILRLTFGLRIEFGLLAAIDQGKKE